MPANGTSTGASTGSSALAPAANATAAAVWPDGNDVDRGVRMSVGRQCEDGRRRRTSSFAGPFAAAAAIAIAMRPRPAALRPRRPPNTASAPATTSQSRE